LKAQEIVRDANAKEAQDLEAQRQKKQQYSSELRNEVEARGKLRELDTYL